MLFAMVAALLNAQPASCEELWPQVWQALEEKELKRGEPPLKRRFPDLEKRLGPFWVEECRRFPPPVLDCARGGLRDRELAEYKRLAEEAKLPAREVEAGLRRLRAEWTVLECREVDRALDRAAAVLAKDAGLE